MGKLFRVILLVSFVIVSAFSKAQILTFDFAGLAGSEASAGSNFNNANLNSSTITRGSGLTASGNGDRFNATSWALTSITNAVSGDDYMEFTITPNAGFSFSVSSIVISLQRSNTGPSEIALRSSADGYSANLGGSQAITDNTSTQTFTFTFAQTNTCNTAVTYRIYMYAEATGGSGGLGDFTGNDIIVNGSVNSCSSNSITTSAIAGSPFAVTCATGTAVNVPFTSAGTFNGGNIYSAELSDATGSFASPTVIGTLNSTANSGTINATIPANTSSGTLYRIRVVSNNPVTTGSDNGTNLTINLTGSCGITTGVIVGSPFTIDCNTWANVSVPFTTIGTYAAGNIFSAQISDASGSFASAVTIGTLSLSGTNPSGNIPSTIFAGLSTGSNYRIRVISSNPFQTGTDNGINLTINNSGSPCYGPLVVNEISQGPSGNLEYFELLVVANNPCATLDLRNFILDDNNGDFSGGPVSGAGIASGHIRFTNHIQWANVPSGSLIVVYNEAGKNTSIPADDPSDLIVPDKVYILPADHSLMEGCITRPTSSDATYSPCTYGIGAWNYISMANDHDAAQVRYPNGTYSHGYSWGGAPMNGGPNNINVTTSNTSGENIYFDNTTDDNYSLVANFTTGIAPADETPGAGNSAANSTYIASLTCIALPVELLEFNVLKLENVNQVYWKTIIEVNSFKFELERSSDMLNFEKVYETPAAGNSNSLRLYSFTDDQIMTGTVYYRLKIIDLNGEISYSNPRAISRYQNIESPFVAGNQFILNGCIENNQLRIFDLSGKLIEQKVNLTDNYSLSHLQSGVYLIDFNCLQGSFRIKFSVIK